MESTRRGFFKTLFAGAAVAVLPKPEILIHRIADPLPMFQSCDMWLASKRGPHSFYYNPKASPMLEVWPKSSFDYAANLKRAEEHLAKIGTTIRVQIKGRTIRIVNPDGTEKRVEINAPASLS